MSSLAPSLTSLLVIAALAAPAAQAGPKPKGNQGQLLLESMEDGVKVYLNKKLIGKTPLKEPILVRPGKYKIEASKPGFTNFVLDVVVKPRQKLPVSLELMPYSGLVKFSCNLAGAEVYVDGKMLGLTPLIKDVLVGGHKVTLVKEGYNDFTTELTVQAGEKHFVEGVLTPFEDISPEVKALAEAARVKAEQERLAAEKLKAEAAAAALAASAPPPASWTDEWYKEWWIWTIAGAVLVTAIAVPVALTSGGGTQDGLNDHEPVTTITLPLR